MVERDGPEDRGAGASRSSNEGRSSKLGAAGGAEVGAEVETALAPVVIFLGKITFLTVVLA